ncbi:DUF6461 domain-containing protein [Streptomyces sp. NPDC002994]|uniref:DUF6461 domain-containing protein n=1 Tax=Streptomyces sp. NPDC002994 TaxID=3154441 RepID=UPI0033BED4FA
MSEDGVQWLAHEGLEGFWLLAAWNISARELLGRVGCSGEELHLTWGDGTSLEVETGVTLLRSVTVGDWSVALGQYGPSGEAGRELDAAVRRASRGTQAVDVSQTTNFDTFFAHASHERTLCTFDPLADAEPRGDQPESMVLAMQRVGLLDSDGNPVEWDERPERDPMLLTLKMVEDSFSLSVPRTILTEEVLTMRAPS